MATGTGETRSGWVAVEGRVVKQTIKAVLFEFSLSLYSGHKQTWIPKKCFMVEHDRSWIKFWFHKQLVEKWDLGVEEAPKRTTKKELCERAMRRIDVDESFSKKEESNFPITQSHNEGDPRFFGNVDKVLEEILS